MLSTTFIEFLDISRNSTYIDFKTKVMEYTYNYNLISSLESWYSALSGKCSRCNNKMIINNNGDYIIYNCKDCNRRFTYFYAHLEENYMDKTFMNMI